MVPFRPRSVETYLKRYRHEFMAVRCLSFKNWNGCPQWMTSIIQMTPQLVVLDLTGNTCLTGDDLRRMMQKLPESLATLVLAGCSCIGPDAFVDLISWVGNKQDVPAPDKACRAAAAFGVIGASSKEENHPPPSAGITAGGYTPPSDFDSPSSHIPQLRSRRHRASSSSSIAPTAMTTKLVRLDLSKTSVQTSAIFQLWAYQYPIQELSLRDCANVSELGWRVLVETLAASRTLRKLDMSRNFGVTPALMRGLAPNVAVLREIDVRDCDQLTTEDVYRVRRKWSDGRTTASWAGVILENAALADDSVASVRKYLDAIVNAPVAVQ